MYLVVIPYFAAAAQGRELEYAVAGWRMHFREEYHIIIAGDASPVVSTGNDITHIPCPRVQDPGPGNYRPHIDHVHKFLTVLDAFPECTGFIYACDDMYAVNDFGIEEVKFPKILSEDMKGNASSTNGWQRDMARTREACIRDGLPIRNWICHLPVWYDRDKLLAIYDRYDCRHTSYVVENLYFNTYFSRRVPMKLSLESDNLKCGIYRKDPDIKRILDAFSGKIWITNSPEGWIPELDSLLRHHYQLPMH